MPKEDEVKNVAVADGVATAIKEIPQKLIVQRLQENAVLPAFATDGSM